MALRFWEYSSANQRGHSPRQLTLERRNLILDLWAAGNTADTAAYICGCSLDAIYLAVRVARKRGDIRATRHKRLPPSTETKA
jgi:hypothetical protein